MADQDPEIDLATDEIVLWRGRPDVAKHFTKADPGLIPFTVLWAAIAGTGATLAIFSPTAPLVAKVLVAVFLGIGVYLVIGRFFVKAALKRRTAYVITNRRAIVARPQSQRDVAFEGMSVHLTTSGDRRHITATLRPTGYRRRFFEFSGAEIYANTGLDLLWPGAPLAFYDVQDVSGLRDALRARFGEQRTDDQAAADASS